MSKQNRSKFAQVRHPFLYKLTTGNGKVSVHKAWAKVVHAKKPVTLTLTAEHVRRSIKLKGAGNTSTCAMALCTYYHAESFSHPVEGHCDWQYSRVFIVTKLNKEGLPSQCVAYEHNDRKIARLNDDGKTGQQRLLRLLERNGPMEVNLYPIRYRSENNRPGRDRRPTGKRDPLKQLKGANIRYAVYQLGATPVAQ